MKGENGENVFQLVNLEGDKRKDSWSMAISCK